MPISYVAFLRGINVGGKNLIAMSDLKKAFEELGFRDVTTLLASGNVLFKATNAKDLRTKIEKKLKTLAGKDINVLLRTIDDLKALGDPFKGIKVTPETRLYVTFLTEKPKGKVRDAPPAFRIVKKTDTEVCSVLTLGTEGRTVDLMATLEKDLGKSITTRNWNTVVKCRER